MQLSKIIFFIIHFSLGLTEKLFLIFKARALQFWQFYCEVSAQPLAATAEIQRRTTQIGLVLFGHHLVWNGRLQVVK